MPVIVILLPIVVVFVALSLRVVKEYDRGVIFFLGKYTSVRGPGLIILIPILEQMTRVTLRTITMNIPSQKIITKDNVSIDIAAVAYYHIVDPKKSVIAIENVNAAINQISQTTVRNVVGQFSLDQLLSQTLDINAKIKDVIDGHTEPWGAQVTAVEIKDITLPDNMQRAMAKEAEAERERRAKIVAAEGEFQAAVKLGEAADIISQHPVALQLRTLQTMAEISVEKNSTIIFPGSIHDDGSGGHQDDPWRRGSVIAALCRRRTGRPTWEGNSRECASPHLPASSRRHRCRCGRPPFLAR